MAFYRCALPASHDLFASRAVVRCRVWFDDREGNRRWAIKGTEWDVGPGQIIEVTNPRAEAAIASMSTYQGEAMFVPVASGPRDVDLNVLFDAVPPRLQVARGLKATRGE